MVNSKKQEYNEIQGTSNTTSTVSTTPRTTWRKTIAQTKSSCPVIVEGELIFQETGHRNRSETSCPAGYTGRVSKSCNDNNEWEPTSYLNCTRQAFRNALQMLSGEVNQEVIASIWWNVYHELKNSHTIFSGDIKTVVEMMVTMGKVMKTKNVVLFNYILHDLSNTVINLLSANNSAWKEVSKGDGSENAGAQLLESMEDITQTILKSDNFTGSVIDNNNIAFYLKKKTKKEIRFPDLNERVGRNHIRLVQSGTLNVKYAVIVYKKDIEKINITISKDVYGDRRAEMVLNSDVVLFSVEPKQNEEFLKSQPLELTFFIKNNSGYYPQKCVYLAADNSWSTDGCTTNKTTSDRVVCLCTRLSTFAVLMDTLHMETSTGRSDQICQENEQVAVKCPEGYKGTATKRCTNLGKWETNNNDCTRISLQEAVDRSLRLPGLTESASRDSIAGIAKDVAAAYEENAAIVSGDIRTVVNIIERIGVVTQSKNIAVTNETLQNITTTVDKLLATDGENWRSVSKGDNSFEAGSKLMLSLEDITQSLIISPDNFTNICLNKSNIVVELKENKTKEIIFPDPKKLPSLKETDNELRLVHKEVATLKYSIIIYKNISEKFYVRNVNDYSETNKHEIQETISLNSDVISFSVEPEPDPEYLKVKPVILTFRSRSNMSGHQTCAYLLKEGTWATDGCDTKLDQDKVVCTCTHLTNYAVLMSPYEIHETHWNILGFISSVGIVISLVCLAVTIATYGIMWRYLKSDRAVLHVHLSASLFLGYTVFLVGISRTHNSITCAIVAGLLHFLFLVVFFVMLAQGLLILKSVTSVSSTSILKWLILLVYGGPIGVVTLSVAVTQGVGYGSQKVCWLDNSSGLLWAFVAPAFTVLLVNFIILMIVLRMMQTSQAMRDKNVSKRTKSVLRSVCILSPILGITWAFGVLSISSDKVVFQYLFALSNSLQGLFIFIFQCVLQYQVRDAFRALIRRYRATSSFDSRTMNSSQDKSYSENFVQKNTQSDESEFLKKSDGLPMKEIEM